MIETVLFDLDGTIVDTNELIIATFLQVLEGRSDRTYTREELVPHMGRPLLEQLRFFTGREDVAELVPLYREYNLARHDELVREFPHVREVVAALREGGIRLGVVTSKVRLTTDKGLKFCGLFDCMDAIVTFDDVDKPKPDPEGIVKAMQLLDANPETTLMVGDSQFDLLAAQAAGVKSAGVAWSLKGEAFLRQYKPDYMLHDMRDLLDIAGVTRGAR
ncbi:MAG: pyrophosphatase PpaX [Paenibacillaceae bacterium]|nr:pyrophosphatase PpaX [Paenibacillaceae bacterium]